MVAFLAEHEVDMYDYKEMNIARDGLKNAISDLDYDFVTKNQEKKFKHWFCDILFKY